MSATKSPLSGVPDQQTYERLLQGLGAADVYRQIPLAFDPAALPRGIHIDPGIATFLKKIITALLYSVCIRNLAWFGNLPHTATRVQIDWSVIVALEYLWLEWAGKSSVISPLCCETIFLSRRLIWITQGPLRPIVSSFVGQFWCLGNLFFWNSFPAFAWTWSC